MLLAIDVGNSNISVGLFGENRELKFLSSIDTDGRKTADQISIDLMNIFSLYHYDLSDVTGAAPHAVTRVLHSSTLACSLGRKNVPTPMGTVDLNLLPQSAEIYVW